MAVAAVCCAAIMPVLLGIPARTTAVDVAVARTPLAAPALAVYGELPPESEAGSWVSEGYEGAEPITFGDDPSGRGRSATGLTGNGIPMVAMQAYRAAADTTARTTPRCGIDWALLAAIGRIESDHGRHGGATLGADGVAVPAILGPTLTKIRDTDGGRLDGDRTFDRAVGPMQFIPGTWQGYGADGNGDGRADPQNIFDAALAAARYLCSGGADLVADPEQAVYRYNHSVSYVAQVLALAEAYRSGLAGSLPEPRAVGTTSPGTGADPTGSGTLEPSPTSHEPDPTPSDSSTGTDPPDSPDPSGTHGDSPQPTDSATSPSPTVTASSPRPTATKTPTETPTPSTTPCPSDTATPTPTPSPSPTCTDDKTDQTDGEAQGRALSAALLAADNGDVPESPTPTDSPTPCTSPRPTGTTTPTPTPTPTTSCEPTPCATSTSGTGPSPTPCTTESPDPTPSDDPTPTTSPTPTDTPKPTPTPSSTGGGSGSDGGGSDDSGGSSTAENPELQTSNVGGLVTGSTLESTATPEPVVAPLPSVARLHATIIALTRDPCIRGVHTAAPPWNGDRPRPVPVPAAVPVTGLPTHYPGIDSAVLGSIVVPLVQAPPAYHVDVRSQARSPPGRSPPERAPPTS